MTKKKRVVQANELAKSSEAERPAGPFASEKFQEVNDQAKNGETGKPADPFAPENLRLSQSFAETVAVKKLITTVSVRKPNSQDFVRVHADPAFRENFTGRRDRERHAVPGSQQAGRCVLLAGAASRIRRQGL